MQHNSVTISFSLPTFPFPTSISIFISSSYLRKAEREIAHSRQDSVIDRQWSCQMFRTHLPFTIM